MTDVQKFKARLEEEKSTLDAELNTIAERNPANPQDWEGVQKDTVQEADPNDQASLQDEYQENRAITGVLNPRYQEVLAALNRIEEGTYGTCSVCSEQIEEDRLDADPAAQTCMAHLGA